MDRTDVRPYLYERESDLDDWANDPKNKVCTAPRPILRPRGRATSYLGPPPPDAYVEVNPEREKMRKYMNSPLSESPYTIDKIRNAWDYMIRTAADQSDATGIGAIPEAIYQGARNMIRNGNMAQDEFGNPVGGEHNNLFRRGK